MGDVNQVLPLAMKSIADDSSSNSSCTADTIGEIAFSAFMDPPNQLETFNFIFHMTDVVSHEDQQFKHILSLMRYGTLTNEKCEFLINRFLSKSK